MANGQTSTRYNNCKEIKELIDACKYDTWNFNYAI